jgi:hypothetical protein
LPIIWEKGEGGDDSSLFYFYSNDAAMSCEMLRCVGKLISETLTN